MFLLGTLSIWFTVAHQSYLPRLLPAAELVSANAKLSANTSVAALAGASAGGFLVQLVTAPLVFAVDALSFLWSALWIRSVRHREPPVERPPTATSAARSPTACGSWCASRCCGRSPGTRPRSCCGSRRTRR
jgi:hypothetical protein